ncbi:Uma2 family endonuclease [Acaryochloris sp. IP29b_bin.137]|uniref:Uma2 family endonuclease n=1 Tax=Acaryochloris sp. IP29b_bin.137 TaxID=2969217 RepID=UPI00261F9E4B|nr:Uma2 family endonuclease [Acaryochloris sp. IP29b_bin.137]
MTSPPREHLIQTSFFNLNDVTRWVRENSSRPIYPYGKFYYYEQILKVPTYVIFDPATPVLEVRQLQTEHYELQTLNDQDRYWVLAL